MTNNTNASQISDSAVAFMTENGYTLPLAATDDSPVYARTVSYLPRHPASMHELDAVSRVIAALDGMGEHADTIHISMVELIDNLRGLGRKSILEHEGLARIFAHDFKGVDRGSLVAWVHAYTPIKINFDAKTGRFDSIGWSNAKVKRCKKNGEPVYNMNGLASVHWALFAPERTRAVNAGNVVAGIKALATQSARACFDNSVEDVERIKREAFEAFETHFDSELNKVLSSDQHAKWCSDRLEDAKKAAKK